MPYDYLAIGHVTLDVWSDGSKTPGGTVLYSALTARAMFDSVAALTVAGPNFDMGAAFRDVDTFCVESPRTTEFENRYTAGHRHQVTRPSPIKLHARHLTPEISASRVIHLAPVCDEIALDLVRAIPTTAFVGVTPQGWMRRWDEHGRVSRNHEHWRDAETVFEMADCVVVSLEDVEGDWAVLTQWATRARVLVVTQGPRGCTAMFNGDLIHAAAPPVDEVDPTGAGDIFATSLFAALLGDDNAHRLTRERVHRACAFANCVAADSVTRPQMRGVPTREDAQRCGTI